MNQALSIGKTGLDAQQKRMAVISNNLANVSTTGFKRDSVAFEDLLYQTQRQAGGASSEQTNLPTGLSIGTGSRVSATASSSSGGRGRVSCFGGCGKAAGGVRPSSRSRSVASSA